MGVAVVSGDNHIVPLVVIQWAITIALDNIRSISKVKHVMYIPAKNKSSCFEKVQKKRSF